MTQPSELTRYTIHNGEECGGDSMYQVLKGPDGLEVWLTEPEDRNFHRDLKPLVEHVAALAQRLAECQQQLGTWKAATSRSQDEVYKFQVHCRDLEAKLSAVELERDECREAYSSDLKVANELQQQLTAQRQRVTELERALNGLVSIIPHQHCRTCNQFAQEIQQVLKGEGYE